MHHQVLCFLAPLGGAITLLIERLRLRLRLRLRRRRRRRRLLI